LGPETQARILAAVQSFNTFDDGNDPWGEHDFGAIVIDGERVFFKIDYYDRKNAPLKTLVFRNYKQYLDRYWRAEEMFMENHQTGKSTLLTWKQYDFRVGLNDGDFNKNSLKRAR
jgi:hypothetical protein